MLESYSVEDLKGFLGREVEDRNGETAGRVDDLFVDEGTDHVEWLGVSAGAGASRRSLVPVWGAEVVEDVLRLQWTKDVVAEAPGYPIEEDEVPRISPQEEEQALGHYGLEPSEGVLARVRNAGRLRCVGGATAPPPGRALGGGVARGGTAAGGSASH